MDLHQTKLTKSEWDSIEVPVSQEEKDVLELIVEGFHTINIKKNKHNSLFGHLKIEYSAEMEDHLYNKYFTDIMKNLVKLYPDYAFLQIAVNGRPTVKKADIIRIEKNTPEKMRQIDPIIYEYLLLDLVTSILSLKKNGGSWVLPYFTLHKLCKNNISTLNRHIKGMVDSLLQNFEEYIDLTQCIEQSVELIEKNKKLLQYADQMLYEHQKQLFAIVKSPAPKLVLYIAPTGTGKTLSPIGISETKKVIFVCAARHVGLALAKSAISINKKVAFAFGCASAADIRLHYFSAKEFSKNRKSGGIWKVDNSVGDKVEIMICDVKSYLPAMFYMMAFNPVDNIVTYWDEPTISMDYAEHPLHEIIKKNWCENLIPNVILSSATLPKVHELPQVTADFRGRFSGAGIHSILSTDCKKSIPIINRYGYTVMPHTLPQSFCEMKEIVRHCLENQTLMRYIDLQEAKQCILYIEMNQLVPASHKINRCFTSMDDITMGNIKLHYLRVLDNIEESAWDQIFTILNPCRKRKIHPNSAVDNKGVPIRKVASIGPGVIPKNSSLAGHPITKSASVQVLPTTSSHQIQEEQRDECAIYVTTKDAYTLTDGPTLFLAENVDKIAKFCIQQAAIPERVMVDIMEKIEFNNTITENIVELEHKIEDYIEKHGMKEQGSTDSDKALSKKDRPVKENKDPILEKMYSEITALQEAIRTAELNETFIPNKDLHLKKWAPSIQSATTFTSNIDDQTIMDIMMLHGIENSWKILLLMGIGVFTKANTNIAYMEIMKKLADQQRLYLIIASSDYIYGTNYQFCHGYLSKDLSLTQEKIIQALGRVGRNNIQQDYSVRFRDDAQGRTLFAPEADKIEVTNMNRLFSV